MNTVSPRRGTQRHTAARLRPATYPEGLPFVADRDVETSEPDSGSYPRVARWLVGDPDMLFSTLISASIADGWRIAQRPPRSPVLAAADCLLERGGLFRGVTITRIDTLALVSVIDSPVRTPQSETSTPA